MGEQSKVEKGSVHLMVFPKAAFSDAELDRVKQEFVASGSKLIVAAYNNNTPSRPEVVKIA